MLTVSTRVTRETRRAIAGECDRLKMTEAEFIRQAILHAIAVPMPERLTTAELHRQLSRLAYTITILLHPTLDESTAPLAIRELLTSKEYVHG